METIKIELKVKHFEGANFTDNKNCPLAKALKEYFFTDNAYVRIWSTKVDGAIYKLDKGKGYRKFHFDEDKIKAELSSNPEEVIRILEIQKLN